MSVILGIHDGHDAGAALTIDGKIVAAVNEERLNRVKLYWGFPEKAIKEVISLANIDPSEIDHIIFGSKGKGKGLTKKSSKLLDLPLIRSNFVKSTYQRINNVIRKTKSRRYLNSYFGKIGVDAPIDFLDHHTSHAANAYFTSGKVDPLIVTIDGVGDGISGTVSVFEKGQIKRLESYDVVNSIGFFYSFVTKALGFKMLRHEGKITGLAAYGNEDVAYDDLKKLFWKKDRSHAPSNKLKKLGPKAIDEYKNVAKKYSKEDLAAATQRITEEIITKIVKKHVVKTGKSDVVTSGGVFANVKLNQRIYELDEVNSFYVHPHMGDGGIAVGACLYQENELNGLKPYKLNDVYFGRGYSNSDIEEVLLKYELDFEKEKDVEAEIAELLADKKIIGRFNGRMEYGPRALGNRSILADPTDPSINDWLNKILNRTEFMPFAPSILESHSPEFYQRFEGASYPARFMTITFDVTEHGKNLAPAVCHIDKTARPQVVDKKYNLSYYKILKEYLDRTGRPVFVNTSFNMHEEPIVNDPEKAVRAFQAGSVDVLAIGDYLVYE